MKILLTGKNGQVGWELNRSLLTLGEVVALDRSQCDLSRPELIPDIIREIKPDIIVNAAAYTAVDKAEEEEVLATTINATSVGVLAEEAKRLNALLVHYSTDYVFDGSKKTPYSEDDTPNPINAYGRSKLAGEEAIKQVAADHLIFRTSWVYASRGSNFIKTMLRLAAEREELKVIDDQFGAPTSAELIADVTSMALYCKGVKKDLPENYNGIYHLVASGKTSWYEFSKLILGIAIKKSFALKMKPNDISPIPSESYLLPAKRPQNSIINTNKLRSTFGLVLPDWKYQAERAVTAVVSKN